MSEWWSVMLTAVVGAVGFAVILSCWVILLDFLFWDRRSR